MQRWHYSIEGAVQGLGFRPFLFRLAHHYQLTGHVSNGPRGVVFAIQGPEASLQSFEEDLLSHPPPLAFYTKIEKSQAAPLMEESRFVILPSVQEGEPSALVLPDLALCRDCRQEILDPANRRFRYPFTNCTHCGPRYSIIHRLPYDRPFTTMASFVMCAACRQEYESPQNRRFHAQPNACADCGPQLYFHSGSDLSHGDAALSHAVSLLQQGGLLALKGLGGYQILGDARSETVVERLRQRKKRPSKPFAIMIPDEGPYLEAFHLRPGEQALLESVQSPIVLLNWQHAPPSWLAPSVFGPSPAIGVMKPYTPLHVLLLNDLGFPVIATSGNLADEPICIDPDQATAKLAPLVDGFLHHTRPILRPVDDSVAQVIRGKAQVLRRARGYAPFPLANLQAQGKDLALGGHLKATFCFSHRQQVFFSQHIGDLESPQSRESYLETLKDLPRMYDQSPEDFSTVACDSHPDYYSSRVLPEREKLPVQHHRAHLYSVMAEHGLKGPILGFAWDGTGWGDDGTIWGGEVFSGDHRQLTRVGSLHPFPLLGGDHSAKEPWRTALSLMVTVFPHQDPRELLNLLEHVPLGHQLSEAQTLPTLGALNRGIRCITTTSMGRLLDGISALLGLATHNTHEGFAPVALQRAAQLYCAETPVSGISFPWLPRPASFSENAPEWVLDWRPALKQLFKEFREGAQAAWALRCHVGLAMAIRDLSLRFPGIPILLSGGVFQNQRLMEMVLDLMQPHQREVYFNEQVPPNDGGLALGQWFAAEQGNFP